MRRSLFLSLLLVCAQLVAPLAAASPKETPKPVVAAYFENWAQYRTGQNGRAPFYPNMVDPTILTDLYYAFALFGFVTRSVDPSYPHLTGDYSLQPIEWNDESTMFPQIQALKKLNPNLKTHLSIGGWSFNDPNDVNCIGTHTYRLFSDMVANPQNRSQFIKSAVSYAHKHGFDGLDIDWEYPGDLTRGGRPEDFDHFPIFIKELSEACHSATPKLLLSIASPAAVPGGAPRQYHENPALYFQWLAKCAQHLDRLNLMCYDYHGAFDTNPQVTGVNAPLNRDTNPASTFYIAQTLKYYLDNGIPANKIVLGMPTYGRSFGGVSGMSPTDHGPGKKFQTAGAAGPETRNPGILAYFEIADMLTKGQLTMGFDPITDTAYGYNLSTREWVSFDTPQTLALKAQMIKKHNLSGAMFWAVDTDEYVWGTTYPLIRSVHNVLNH